MLKLFSTTTVPVATTALVALATVKEDWQIAGTADDAFLTRLIRRCSAAIVAYCNRDFGVSTQRDEFVQVLEETPQFTLWADLAAPVQLSVWPVTEVTEVVENGTTLTGGDGVDWKLEAATGQLWRLDAEGRLKAWSPQGLSVTYSAGAVPDEVEDAASRLVYARWVNRQRNPLVKRERVYDVIDREFDTGSDTSNMPPDVEDLLDNYRMPGFG